MKSLTLEQAKEFCLTMTKLKATVAAEQRLLKAAVRWGALHSISCGPECAWCNRFDRAVGAYEKAVKP